MSDSLITLLIGIGLLLLALWIFWPENGLYARWQRRRRMTARIRREDALKHIHNCEMAGSVASIQSIAGALGVNPRRQRRYLSLRSII